MIPRKIEAAGNLAVFDYCSGEIDIYNYANTELTNEDIEVFLSDLYNLDEIEYIYSGSDKLDVNIYESER